MIPTQIGTACHELGHDLGLPDLYNTLNGEGKLTQSNVGSESLMANGSRGTAAEDDIPGSSPAHMDAWCKIQLGFYGETVARDGGSYDLYPAADSVRYGAIKVPTEDENVYYLVENRQFSSFDAGMYIDVMEGGQRESINDSGLIIWRIDKSIIDMYEKTNEINSYRSPQDYGVMPVFSDSKGVNPFYVPAGGVVFELDKITLSASDMGDYIRVTVKNSNNVPDAPTTTPVPAATPAPDGEPDDGVFAMEALYVSEGGSDAYTLTMTGSALPDEPAYCMVMLDNEMVTDDWAFVELTGDSARKQGSIRFPSADGERDYILGCMFMDVDDQFVSAQVTVDGDGKVTAGLGDPPTAAATPIPAQTAEPDATPAPTTTPKATPKPTATPEGGRTWTELGGNASLSTSASAGAESGSGAVWLIIAGAALVVAGAAYLIYSNKKHKNDGNRK